MPISSLFETPLKTTWNVGGHVTEALWWPADDKIKKSNEEKLVFFMIPGNPGVIDYYVPFLSTIYKETGKKIEIVGVSHMGHSHGPHNRSLQKLYSLQDQIEHKIDCFDKLRDKFSGNESPKFVLCGHSIGAFICSQVLKARPNHGIEKVYALFPTLQHIANTPNARTLEILFNNHSRNVVSLLAQSLRTIFAPHVLRFLVRLFTFQAEPFLSTTTDSVLHGHTVKNALYMAETEIANVQELDEDLYRQHLKKFIFYFGTTDQWAPMDQYYDLKQRFPDANVILCPDGMEHAFILEHSELMGLKVSEWIKNLNYF